MSPRLTLTCALGVVHGAFDAPAHGEVTAPDEFAMRLPTGRELPAEGEHLGGPTIAVKVAAGAIPIASNSGFSVLFDSE